MISLVGQKLEQTGCKEKVQLVETSGKCRTWGSGAAASVGTGFWQLSSFSGAHRGITKVEGLMRYAFFCQSKVR